MKLNNGKGWEAAKPYGSHHLTAANAVPDTSAREVRGNSAQRGQNTTQGHLTAARLNAAQPPPPSPAKPGVGKTRERQSASGAMPPKRASGAAGGLGDVATPTASTQAQFQTSNPNISNLNVRGMNATNNLQSAVNNHHQPPPRPGQEPERSALQKILKVLCCGSR